MRLSHKTYPIWAEIESGLLKSISTEMLLKTKERAQPGIDLKPIWGGIAVATLEAGKGEHNFLTRPFRDAIAKAAPKITGSNTKDYMNSIVRPCIFMHEGGGTIVYATREIEELKLFLVGFNRTHIVAWGTMNAGDNGVAGVGSHAFLDNFRLFPGEDEHQRMCDWFTYILITNYFINNCEIEVKELKPKEKHRTKGEKHMNESKRPIRILDCTWFTTLVSTMPQHVSGFLRWQPYGTQRMYRKLIWVDGFVRNGFTRRAKALSEREMDGDGTKHETQNGTKHKTQNGR